MCVLVLSMVFHFYVCWKMFNAISWGIQINYTLCSLRNHKIFVVLETFSIQSVPSKFSFMVDFLIHFFSFDWFIVELICKCGWNREGVYAMEYWNSTISRRSIIVNGLCYVLIAGLTIFSQVKMPSLFFHNTDIPETFENLLSEYSPVTSIERYTGKSILKRML